jgi:hypothetical protein
VPVDCVEEDDYGGRGGRKRALVLMICVQQFSEALAWEFTSHPTYSTLCASSNSVSSPTFQISRTELMLMRRRVAEYTYPGCLLLVDLRALSPQAEQHSSKATCDFTGVILRKSRIYQLVV